MAKVKLPLMSQSAHGTIGDVLTFSLRGSGQQVRFQRKQKDVISVDRTIQRYLFADAVSAWNALTVNEKEVYNNRAVGISMTGYDLFQKEYLLARKLSHVITPVTVKGGVGRCVDQATGDIARTTTGWIEDEKFGWVASNVAGNWSAEFDSAVSRTGRLTLKLSTTDETGRCIAQLYNAVVIRRYHIPVKPSTSYRISIYVKTNNVATDSVFFDFKEYDEAGNVLKNTESSRLSGTNDWTKLEKIFTTQATTSEMNFRVFNGLAGNVSEAWFDVNSMIVEEISTINNPAPVPVLYYPKVTAVTITNAVDQFLDFLGAYTNTYAIPTAINEGATHRQTFTPTKKKQTSVQVWPVDKGTGNWTLIVHDSSNNLIVSKTILNADITEGAFQDFLNNWDFASGTYHFHVISTQNDGTLKTNTTDNLEACSFNTECLKNTTNFKIKTDTQEIAVTSPTVEGWEDGEVIDTKELGLTPLTLAVGSNNIYYSSNGHTSADLAFGSNMVSIAGGSFYL